MTSRRSTTRSEPKARSSIMGRVIYEALGRRQYLRLPRTNPPLEYIRGRVVQQGDGPAIFEVFGLDEFLRLPEARPALEYLEGRVIQKVSPRTTHSVLQMRLGAFLLDFARQGR